MPSLSLLSHTKFLFLCLAVLARTHSAQGAADCSAFPGQWEGFFNWQPAGETYTLSFGATPHIIKAINNHPSGGEWTKAEGTISSDNATAYLYFPEKDVYLEGPLSANCLSVSWNNTSEWTKVTPVDTVHLLFMSHLDVGFTGLINEVLQSYISSHFPRAAALSAAMRAACKGPKCDAFVYTTHPWLISLYLHCPAWTLAGVQLECPTPQQQADLRASLVSGDLLFHAAPFNVEWENVMTEDMADIFFQLAKDIAAEVGVPAPRTASVRDVPGFTRGIIPLAVRNNVTFISEGVNGETAPPMLLSPSVWLDKDSNTSILYVQHNGGYGRAAGNGDAQVGDGNCARIPGFTQVLCFSFYGEGHGPPDSVEDVKSTFAAFRSLFPNATVVASSFDKFFDALATFAPHLPVNTAEAGESWINGVAGDVSKTVLYRQSALALTACKERGECDMTDKRLRDWGRLVLKTPEHTWGLPTLGDSTSWTNEALRTQRATNPVFQRWEASWIEQRNVTSVYAMAALQDHVLASDIAARMAAWQPQVPAITPDMVPVPQELWGSAFEIETEAGNVTIKLDAVSGGVSGLLLPAFPGVELADHDHQLGVLVYSVLNASDYARVQNCELCYLKGFPASAEPPSSSTRAQLTGLWRSDSSTQAPFTLLLQLDFPFDLVALFGAPSSVWISLEIGSQADVRWDVQLFGKGATRYSEGIYLEWLPLAPFLDGRWLVDKLGSWIDPLDVVVNGAQQQHAVKSGVVYRNPAAATNGLFIETTDAAVVCVNTEENPYTLLPMITQPLTGPVTGFASLLYTNAWAMNYPLWSLDESMRFRFRVTSTLAS